MLAKASREGEHPEYHGPPRCARLRCFRRLAGLRRCFVVSGRLDSRFRHVLAWSSEPLLLSGWSVCSAPSR